MGEVSETAPTSETQDSVIRWATETFGTPGSPLRLVARANAEMAELLSAISMGKPLESISEEAADVLILLMRLGACYGAGADPSKADRPARIDTLLSVHDELYQLSARANVAFAKVIAGVVESDELALEDYATVWRRLKDLIEHAGFSAQEAIDVKMRINRERTWKKDPDGHGFRHVTAA